MVRGGEPPPAEAREAAEPRLERPLVPLASDRHHRLLSEPGSGEAEPSPSPDPLPSPDPASSLPTTFDFSSPSSPGFQYHMYGVTMVNAQGGVSWTLSGDQGNTWQAASAGVHSMSFALEYVRRSGYRGDAAVAQVAVSSSPQSPTASDMQVGALPSYPLDPTNSGTEPRAWLLLWMCYTRAGSLARLGRILFIA